MPVTTADAMSTIETRGYLFDTGQLPKDTRIFLWRMVKMGRLRKASAPWPWFVAGAVTKTVYYSAAFDPVCGTWLAGSRENEP